MERVTLGAVVVMFDRAKLNRLIRAYQECQTDSFMFDGQEYLCAYAKYVIEYLECRLAR